MSRSTKQISAGLTTKSPVAEVTAVQDYLRRFGYLDAPESDFGAPSFPLGDGDDPAGIAGRPSGARKGKLDAPPRPRSSGSRSSRTCPGPAWSTRRRRPR